MSVREKVLYMLSQAQGSLSGESMAEELGVSRAAVWKAIGCLREEGYVIEASANRGYRLRDAENVLTEEGIRRWLVRGDVPVEVHGGIDSTNLRAKALAAQGAPHGTLVTADSQTMGRGRFGRKFHSIPGCGLYMSLILRPRMPAEEAVKVTVLAAVAAAQALEQLADMKVQIKWVNDLYAGGRKLAGILTEAGMDFESGYLDYCVVGIGVNLRRVEYPEEIRQIATSVEEQCGERIPRCRLAAEIVNRLEKMLEQPDTSPFFMEYRERSNVVGHAVTVLRGDERYDAQALAIDDDGGLVVETEHGAEILRSGEVSLRVKE